MKGRMWCAVLAIITVGSFVPVHAALTTGGGASVNPNPEYDTYVEKTADSPDAAAIWEIALSTGGQPSKTYYVTLACGNPSAARGPHLVQLSGDGSSYSTVLNTSTTADNYVSVTNAAVSVTEAYGKLSLKLGGNSVTNNLNFIIITEDLFTLPPISDCTSFSQYQKLDHFRYTYWNGASYQNLFLNAPTRRWTLDGEAAAPLININSFRPGGTTAEPAMLWTAPFDDTIKVQGWTTKVVDPPNYGDGVYVRLVKNGNTASPLWEQFITGDDTTFYPFDVSPITIVAGDTIALHLHKNGDHFFDSTQHNIVISSISDGNAWSASGGFSREQGYNNWSYRRWNGSQYNNLVLNTTTRTWTTDGSNTPPRVNINAQLPGDSEDSVRTWTAPSTGTINVVGWATRVIDPPPQGDGVYVRIVKNSNIGSPLWERFLDYDDYTLYRINLNGIEVNAGDTINFIVNRNGNRFYDSTKVDAVVIYQ
ncbi:MAG: hypothetical protein PHN82_04235 [bacterium]|nr:hypothetical protein [bacterium]